MADQQDLSTDPGLQHLGSVYAKALLGATEKAGNTTTVLAELDSLVDDVLARLPNIKAAWTSPRIGHRDKELMLDKAFAGRMSRELLNFLKVVSKHGRMECLAAIRRAARDQFNALRGRVEVTVRTADALDGQSQTLVRSRLEAALQRDVDLALQVDPQLIGGIVVRVGDTVYDGSVANQLKRMRAETLERTAGKVRAALDRFAPESP